MQDEYSPIVRQTLMRNSTCNSGPTCSNSTNKRKRREDCAPEPSQPTIITPISVIPLSQSSILGNEDDIEEKEWTCFDGEETDAELHEHACKDEAECVYCNHGGNLSGSSNSELEAIHEMEEEYYGTISDQALFDAIASEYKRRIYDPLAQQKNIREKRLKGRTSSSALFLSEPEIPTWNTSTVARHFTHDGLYVLRELGDDIKFTRTIQKHLQFKGIMSTKNGTKLLDGGRARLWKELSKHKIDLIRTMFQLNPSIIKHNRTQTTTIGVKPPGAK